MSELIDLADALVSELNDGDFSQEFTAVRTYVPEYSLEELETLRVTVLPKAQEVSPLTRGADVWQPAADIGVQRRVDNSTNVDADALVALVQEIIDALRRARLEDYPDGRWVSAVNEPIYDPAQLREQQVFTSVITVTYESVR